VWPSLRSVYNSVLERDVFRSRLEKKRGASIEWAKLVELVNAGGSYRRWQSFKSLLALVQLVDCMGLELAKEFTSKSFDYDTESEAGRRQVDRIHAELEQAAFALKMHQASDTGHNLSELYDELKTRCLAA
jgi:hypothetical protein